MYLQDINSYFHTILLLFSSQILAKIGYFNMFNCSTPFKNWSKHRVLQLGGIRVLHGKFYGVYNLPEMIEMYTKVVYFLKCTPKLCIFCQLFYNFYDVLF